jgi:hypothetical protein
VSTTIEAPTSGFLVINAGADVFNYSANDFVDCLVEVNETIQGTSRRSIELNATDQVNREENCSTQVTVQVAAGTHKVDFEGAGVAVGTGFDEAVLQVTFIPFGGDGTQP